MSARLEAAVKAWDHHWGDRYGDEALEEMGEEVQVALAAADAVTFSDEAIEVAEDLLREKFCVDENMGEFDATAVWGTPADIVAIVVAALKGDA